MRIPQRLPRLHAVIAGLVVLVAACAFLALSGSASQAFLDQVPEVRDTFYSAMVVLRTAGYVNPERRSLASALASSLPTADQLHQAWQKAISDHAKYFASGIASTGAGNLIAMQEDPNVRLLGGGVSGIDYKSLDFDGTGTRVTVAARITVWWGEADKNPDDSWGCFYASGALDVRAVMAKQASGAWLITELHQDFAPGSEP